MTYLRTICTVTDVFPLVLSVRLALASQDQDCWILYKKGEAFPAMKINPFLAPYVLLYDLRKR